MQDNNQNISQNNNQNDPKKTNQIEYRLVIDEKPYRKRSVIPMLAMALLFVGVIFGIKGLIGLFIGNEKEFDPNNIEIRKIDDILRDKNVSFYIGGLIYSTRLSNDVEITRVDKTVDYSLIRDSLYYTYSIGPKESKQTFDKTNYYIDGSINTISYLDDKSSFVVSVRSL